MKEIELLKIIFKDSPDILEPLNEIDKENKRLNKELEFEKLKNKEVREYIEKNINENEAKFYGIPDYKVFKGNIEHVLEILDKENI